MNLFNQGESSGGPSIPPAKRRRGRPRKDPSLKQAQVGHGFEGEREYIVPDRDRNRTSSGIECMVGQPVTGVVEATFDAGYLLSVRIGGNSNTNFRGVVFKPGHYVPITPQNDVAPHLQMITRNNNVHFTPQNHQTTPKPAKIVTSPPPTLPVVLASPSGDKDVHMVEPLSMLPPDQLIAQSSHQVAAGNEQNKHDASFNEGTSEVRKEEEEKPEAMTSQASDAKLEDGKEELNASDTNSKQEIENTKEPFSTEPTTVVTKPSFNYGTGRMTQLLQALQENVNETQVQVAEHPTSGTELEFHEMTTETDPKNGIPGDLQRE